MGASILCVDNDRNLCEILAKALRGEGYRVTTAFDGERAVEILRRTPQDFVLLDLMLPEAGRLRSAGGAARPAGSRLRDPGRA